MIFFLRRDSTHPQKAKKRSCCHFWGAEMFKYSDAGSKMKLRSKVNMDEMGGQKLRSKVNEVGVKGLG